MRVQFLTEDPPPRGIALNIAPGIRRIVADNPGPMTYRGTNTYLLGWQDGVAVVDPGPDDADHVRDVLNAAGGPIRAILLTHGHHDHSGALPALRGAADGAEVYAWADSAYAPDVKLADGDVVGRWRAVHTPGHAPDHLAFAGPGGVTLSGDHVMSWSSTVVGGPAGDMAAYFDSLRKILAIPSTLYLPGHGPPLPEPWAYVTDLLAHRTAREAAIAAALGPMPRSVESLAADLYPGLVPALAGPAAANVLAHLNKLLRDGRARRDEAGWAAAPA